MSNRGRENWPGRGGLGPLPFMNSETKGGRERMGRREFRDALLGQMERKTHWADTAYAGMVPKEKIVHRLVNDYGVFVYHFPQYLRGALMQCPEKLSEVRYDLVKNIDEEETGMHYAKEPHPELFLRIPRALGFDMQDFENPALGPKAQAYRDFLFDATHNRGWSVGVVISTLFLEGNKFERSVFPDDFPDAPRRPEKPLEEHGLMAYEGMTVEALELVRVHRVLDSAEGEHRQDAWNMILNHIPPTVRRKVLKNVEEAIWFFGEWQDEVAERSGLEKGPDGKPRLIGKLNHGQ